MRGLLPVVILSVAPILLHGQAIVEYGATAGSTAAAATGAATGKSVKSVFDRVNKTLAGASKADEATASSSSPGPTGSSSASRPVSAPAPAAPALPADFSEVIAGMDRADLIRKAGKPSMSVTSVESSALVETCWYRAGDDRVTVVLRNGKVATISGADRSAAK
jgi:hypothetical protein